MRRNEVCVLGTHVYSRGCAGVMFLLCLGCRRKGAHSSASGLSPPGTHTRDDADTSKRAEARGGRNSLQMVV